MLTTYVRTYTVDFRPLAFAEKYSVSSEKQASIEHSNTVLSTFVLQDVFHETKVCLYPNKRKKDEPGQTKSLGSYLSSSFARRFFSFF